MIKAMDSHLGVMTDHLEEDLKVEAQLTLDVLESAQCTTK